MHGKIDEQQKYELTQVLIDIEHIVYKITAHNIFLLRMSSAPHSNTRISSNKLNIHEQRLKNSKRLFDQLHRTHMHTFVARKQHLQQQHDNQMADLIKAQSKGIQANQLVQNGNISIAKNRRSDNIEIIKKMLQINSHNNAKKNKELQTNRNGIKYRAGKDLQFSFDRQRQSKIFDDAQQSNQSFYTKRRSKIISNHNIEERYNQQVSQLSRESLAQNSKKRGYHNYSQVSNNEFDIGKMVSPIQSKSSSKPASLPKTIHSRRPSNSQNSLSSVQTLIPLSLHSYVVFINSPQDIKQLHIHFNFASLRKMNPAEAWKQLDTRNAKVIENLLFGIVQSLQKYKKVIHKNDDENTALNDLKFIKDCCRLYFNNYEKAKLEMILKQHYFKTYAFKLNPLFVYQRIGMYICYLLCCKVSRTSHQTQEMISMILSLKSIYSLIITVITQTEQTNPTIQSVTLAFQGRNQKQVQETFQILRLVGEIQKHVNQLQKHILSLVQSVAGESKGNNDIWEIYRILKQFLKEESYGIGAKSYQNFIKTEMLLSWKYLQVPPTPFLPPIKSNYSYSIVLDLDETLLYFNQQSNLLKFRPFLQIFLTGLKVLNFEIICFSASSKSYADTLIKQIQHKTRIFEYRLYREHLSLFNGRLVKDIRRLGRDMSKTILIDDLKANFINCSENGIEVSSWQGNKADTQLLIITGILRNIKKGEGFTQSKQKTMDLRVLLKQNRKSLQQMLQQNESINN